MNNSEKLNDIEKEARKSEARNNGFVGELESYQKDNLNRLNKLEVFIESKAFKVSGISFIQQALLVNQLEVMKELNQILIDRLEGL